MDTIASSLQAQCFDVHNLVGSATKPLIILSTLSTNVDSAFESITSTCQLLGSAVNVGSIDNALSGVKSALVQLIDTIGPSASATVHELALAIDNSIDEIIQLITVLVSSVNKILESIKHVTPVIDSVLQAVLKTTIIVVDKSLETITFSIRKLDQFVTPHLSTVSKILSEEITDSDVSIPIDIDKICSELQQCSEGTVVNVECVSSSLDGSSNYVDVVVTAISTCPASELNWASSLDDLKSSVARSCDEIIYTIETVAKGLPGWSQDINSAIADGSLVVLELINSALSASNGNDEYLELSIENTAESVRNILNALASVTRAANVNTNELESNVLQAIQLSSKTIIEIIYDVFYAILAAIDGFIDTNSLMSALTAILQCAIDGPASALVELIPAINYICNK